MNTKIVFDNKKALDFKVQCLFFTSTPPKSAASTPNQIILITLQAESVLQFFLILSGNQQFRHFVKWWIKHTFAILYNHQIINIDNIRLMYLHETG